MAHAAPDVAPGGKLAWAVKRAIRWPISGPPAGFSYPIAPVRVRRYATPGFPNFRRNAESFRRNFRISCETFERRLRQGLPLSTAGPSHGEYVNPSDPRPRSNAYRPPQKPSPRYPSLPLNHRATRVMASPAASIAWRSIPKRVGDSIGLSPVSTGIQTSDTVVLYRLGNPVTRLYIPLLSVG